MNLTVVKPHPELASSGYCLANPGSEYLVYQPQPSEPVTVELKAGTYLHEWFNPATGLSAGSDRVEVRDGRRQFKAPFDGESVLYLTVQSAAGVELEPDSLWRHGSPESQGFSAVKLEALRAGLVARNTKALLVLRNDTIVCEWYAPGQNSKTRFGTASLAKALVGGVSFAVALSDGRMGLDDPATRFIRNWRDDPRKSRITLRQLGSHTSGIEDAEAEVRHAV